MESTNARHVEKLPEPVELVTIDASFISLKVLLPVVRAWFGDSGGEVIALIKPQFEAGRKQVSRGKGVIRDPEVHLHVLLDVLSFVVSQGYTVRNLIQSPIQGPKGNIEFLAHLVYPSETTQADLRRAQVEAFYQEGDTQLFAEFDIAYVFFGPRERDLAEGGWEPDPDWEVAFRQGEVTIYRVGSE